MKHTVYFRGSRAEAQQAVRAVVAGVVRSGGTIGKAAEAARGVSMAVGVAALSDISQDFVRKARGGTGEDGNKWPRLSRAYLAYGRRFGPGEKSALKRAEGLGRANRYAPGGRSGLLTASQLHRWRQVFRRTLAWLATKMELKAAKGIAAGHAWNVIKLEGARTKWEVFGDRTVEILRDTGVLLASLSPGEFDGQRYDPPENQIFLLIDAGVIVGTNVPHAGVHQHGSKKPKGRGGGIPARPFLPLKGAPAVWRARWTRVAASGITSAVLLTLEAA